MAGSQDPNDNPVAINVVPMVDVIFCLCVFFMCSFKFKQIEGKFDTWLPKDKGTGGPGPQKEIEEVRIALFWKDAEGKTERRMGRRLYQEDNELESAIKEAHESWVRRNKPDTPVIIDADARCPWKDVISVVNLVKRNGIDKLEFAFGASAPAQK